MKISILGAGAMGCLFGARLSGKNEIDLINGSPDSVAEINANGVTVTDPSGKILHTQIKSRITGSDAGPCDLLIVFVKNYATDAALAANRNLIGENTVLLSLQNGMGHETVAEKYLPKERILIGITKDNSVSEGPGRVIHSGKGPMSIGSLCGNEALTRKIMAVFNDSGFDCSFSDNVRRLMWSKLFVNLAANPVTAILGCRSGYLAECSNLNSLCRALLEEAVAVAAAEGQEFDAEDILKHFTEMSASYSQGRTSMCQDMEKKRKTEIDYINGAVSSLGKQYGVPTPTNDAIINLVHAREYINCAEG